MIQATGKLSVSKYRVPRRSGTRTFLPLRPYAWRVYNFTLYTCNLLRLLRATARERQCRLNIDTPQLRKFILGLLYTKLIATFGFDVTAIIAVHQAHLSYHETVDGKNLACWVSWVQYSAATPKPYTASDTWRSWALRHWHFPNADYTNRVPPHVARRTLSGISQLNNLLERRPCD